MSGNNGVIPRPTHILYAMQVPAHLMHGVKSRYSNPHKEPPSDRFPVYTRFAGISLAVTGFHGHARTNLAFIASVWAPE